MSKSYLILTDSGVSALSNKETCLAMPMAENPNGDEESAGRIAQTSTGLFT